jgi:hypothetical protein
MVIMQCSASIRVLHVSFGASTKSVGKNVHHFWAESCSLFQFKTMYMHIQLLICGPEDGSVDVVQVYLKQGTVAIVTV